MLIYKKRVKQDNVFSSRISTRITSKSFESSEIMNSFMVVIIALAVFDNVFLFPNIPQLIAGNATDLHLRLAAILSDC